MLSSWLHVKSSNKNIVMLCYVGIIVAEYLTGAAGLDISVKLPWHSLNYIDYKLTFPSSLPSILGTWLVRIIHISVSISHLLSLLYCFEINVLTHSNDLGLMPYLGKKKHIGKDKETFIQYFFLFAVYFWN